MAFPTSKSDLVDNVDDVMADHINNLEDKVGNGAANNAPAANKLLRGTGAGTSEWDKDCPTGAIVGTTDTQTLSNKTLTTPKVDTINEKTADAGVTVDGLKIKDGAISAFKVLQSNDTSFSTNSTSYVDTDASLDITIPTGQKADILLFGFSSLYSQNQAIGVNARIAWNTGGTPSYGVESVVNTVALTRVFMSFSYLLSDVAAGNYTTKVQMKVSADQITCNGPGVYLNAIVIPKPA